MHEGERSSRAACHRYAPLLAMLDDAPEMAAALDSGERQAALDHLADCASCQANQRADVRIDSDLRRIFGPEVASPLRTNELLAAIGATSEPVAMPHWAARPTRDAIRSVIYLGDLDGEVSGGFDRMSETPEPEQRAGEQDAPARKMAAIPSLRPAPRRLAAQAWAMGFSATAVAVVMIVVAVTLFGSHMRPTATQTAHGGATQTSGAHGAAGMANLGAITAISMDSPTDGWAIGATNGPQAGGPQTSTTAFYHYDGSQWRLAQQVAGMNPSGMNGTAYLKILSPTDGWVYDGVNTPLRYDGMAWKPATITIAGNQHVAHLIALDMISSTEGYVAAYLNGGAAGSGAIRFLRYDGQQWTVEQGVIAPPEMDLSNMTISSIFALPGGDAWAVGSAPFASTGTGVVPAVGLVFHRVGGAWHVVSELNQPSAAEQVYPRGIYMSSPTSGWIIGETDQYQTNSEGTTITSHTLILRYDERQNGTRWFPMTAPIANPTTGDWFNQITASGPDDVWVKGSRSGAIITSALAVSALLLHYDGANWTQVMPSLPTLAGVNSAIITWVSLAPDGTLWASGVTEKIQNNQGPPAPLICSYRNGAWSVATIVTK